MKNGLTTLLGSCLLTLPAMGWSQAQEARPLAQLGAAAETPTGDSAESLALAGSLWSDGRVGGGAAAGVSAGSAANLPKASGLKAASGKIALGRSLALDQTGPGPAPGEESKSEENEKPGFKRWFLRVESPALEEMKGGWFLDSVIGGAMFIVLLPVALLAGGVGAFVGLFS